MSKWWWYQEGLDLKGVRTASRYAEREEIEGGFVQGVGRGGGGDGDRVLGGRIL